MCSWKRNNLSMPSNCLYLFNPILLPFSEVVCFIPVYFLVSGSMHSWKLKLLSKTSVARLHLPLINRDLKNCAFSTLLFPSDPCATWSLSYTTEFCLFQGGFLPIFIPILQHDWNNDTVCLISKEIKCEPL